MRALGLSKNLVDLTGGSGDLGVLMTRIRMIGPMRSVRLLCVMQI